MQKINIPQPLYKVDLVVQGKSHFYDVTCNDVVVRYPGVTGMLSVIAKPALVPWAKRESLALVEDALFKRLNGKKSARIMLNKAWIDNLLNDAKKQPEVIKEVAADLGSQAHAFIDLIIHGKEPEKIPNEIISPVTAFKDWWKSSGIELLMGDTKVASRIYGYGGSLDALGWRHGKGYVLMDFKTSSKCWPEYALQVAAYCQAIEETFGIKCYEAIIIRLSKKAPVAFEVKTVTNIDASFQAFLAAKTLKTFLENDPYAW